jgi:hypothetical protein
VFVLTGAGSEVLTGCVTGSVAAGAAADTAGAGAAAAELGGEVLGVRPDLGCTDTVLTLRRWITRALGTVCESAVTAADSSRPNAMPSAVTPPIDSVVTTAANLMRDAFLMAAMLHGRDQRSLRPGLDVSHPGWGR